MVFYVSAEVKLCDSSRLRSGVYGVDLCCSNEGSDARGWRMLLFVATSSFAPATLSRNIFIDLAEFLFLAAYGSSGRHLGLGSGLLATPMSSLCLCSSGGLRGERMESLSGRVFLML
ncbi:unnamed protein product [Brassica oleracea var. botrytis]